MVPERLLGESQLEVLRRCSNAGGGHHWIRGFAGSGKTVLLVHLIDRILAANDKARICVAVYTHALKDLIGTGVSERYRTRVPVMTFDQLLAKGRTYDWIMLDEVQDIPADKLRRIERLARHIVAAGDTDQSIYDKCSTADQIQSCLDPQAHHLTVLYRLTQKIRDVARVVMPNSGIETAATHRMQQVDVTLAHADSIKRENEWVWENLRKHSRVGEPAVALFSRHNDIKRFIRYVCEQEDAPEPAFDEKGYDSVNKALQENGVPLQYLGNDCGSLRESDGRPIAYLMTYHSAKGLDFDTVFLPHLAKERTFWKDNEGIDRRLFFVGLTRSRKNLFLSYSGAEPHEYVQNIPDGLLYRIECKRAKNRTSEPDLFF